MSKKLKITESQYKRLLGLLIETPFDQLVNNTIEVGDVIQVTRGGNKLLFKIISSEGGEIVMDGITTGIEKNRYMVNASSLEGNKMEGRYVNKTTNPSNDVNTWPQFNLKIDDFEVIRDNQVVDAADINGKSSFVPPQNQEEPENNQNTEKPETTTSGDTESNDLEDDGQSYNTKDIFKLVLGDKKIQDIFYRQPGFWQKFMAELKGGKAKGRGLITLINSLSQIAGKAVDSKIGIGFENSGKVKYAPLQPINLSYTTPEGKNGNTAIKSNVYNYISISSSMDTDEKVLMTKRTDICEKCRLRILVKAEHPDQQKPNVKICTVAIVEETSKNEFQELSHDNDEYEIQFFQSRGYNSQPIPQQPNPEPNPVMQPKPNTK